MKAKVEQHKSCFVFCWGTTWSKWEYSLLLSLSASAKQVAMQKLKKDTKNYSFNSQYFCLLCSINRQHLIIRENCEDKKIMTTALIVLWSQNCQIRFFIFCSMWLFILLLVYKNYSILVCTYKYNIRVQYRWHYTYNQ